MYLDSFHLFLKPVHHLSLHFHESLKNAVFIFLHFNLSHSNFFVALRDFLYISLYLLQELVFFLRQRDPLFRRKLFTFSKDKEVSVYEKRNVKKLIISSQKRIFQWSSTKKVIKKQMLANTLDFRLSRSNYSKTKFSTEVSTHSQLRLLAR